MATIEPRKDSQGRLSYRAKVRIKGQPTTSATFSKLADAKRWAAQTETAIRQGRYFKAAAANRLTLASLCQRYSAEIMTRYSAKEQADRTHRLQHWLAHLGPLYITDVTPAAISEAKSQLPQTLAPATVDKYLKTLSHVFSTAQKEWHSVEDNPVSKILPPKLPRGRVRYLSEIEREALLTACRQSSNPTLYLCVSLALATGMRRSELMTLTWADVNLKDGAIILQKTKNGERRRVPLSSRTLAMLKEHAKVRRLDTPLLFPGKADHRSPIDLRAPFEKALCTAGITDFRWHDLRHCTASYLAMNGATLAEIAEVLGHKTLAMVKRYAHLSDSHTSQVVERMNQQLFG